jgi:hypothetical protein
VRCPVETFSDFGALGTIVGKIARNRIPYFRNILADAPTIGNEQHTQHAPNDDHTPDLHPATDMLKTLGAAMAASGAVPLYHIHGVTPEAMPNNIMPDAEHVVITSLAEGYAMLNSDDGTDIDLVWFGCPHASLQELRHILDLLNGRKAKVPIWVTMARVLREVAAQRGMVAELESLGGKVVADTCLVVAPMRHLGYKRIATASGKGAYYTPSHSGLAIRYGTLESCVDAAVSGKWGG